MNNGITWKEQNLFLTVTIQTKSSKDEIIVKEDYPIKIKIKAPPIDNAANDYLIKFLAKTFGATQAQIKILKGIKSKNKLICINNPKRNLI